MAFNWDPSGLEGNPLTPTFLSDSVSDEMASPSVTSRQSKGNGNSDAELLTEY